MKTRKNPNAWLAMSIFLLLMVSTAAGGTIYVDADASGSNDGSSWADAYNYLQDALIAATSGDEIRVAEGIYKPDEDSAHPNGTGSRTATFQLINAVAVKGGYAGFGEPDPNEEQDPNTYETVLSGDLLGNDGPNFANNGENSYHVVTGSGTNETAVLNGFTITGGNANGSLENMEGGGMLNESGSPTLTNCTFSGNSAGWNGGGMFNYYSNPTLTNCTFSSNSATRRGGGMLNDGNSNSTLTNCTFSGNSANRGGGMNNYYSSPSITNCTFSGNSAVYGGAMSNAGSIPTLTNCTFSGNSADRYGGGISNSRSSLMVTNCILWDNTAPQMYNDGTSSATVSYSDVQGGWPGEGNIDADPCFVEPDYLGPISYWKFDEGGGTTAYDSAGNYDGTIYGAEWTAGQLGGALSFGWGDGVYVEESSGADSPLNIYNSDMAISAWVKLRGPGGTIVARAKPHYITYRLLTWPTTACISVYAPGHHYICSDAILNQDTWYHIAGVFDRASNTGYLYVDGILEADGSMPDAPPGNGGLTKIGCRNDVYDYPFNGTIDEVMIFNKALSAEEIQQLYQIGLTGHNDYHLLPDSPCINAGDPNYAAEPNETDLDGKPRVIGGRIDMGAYELNHIPVADAGPNQTVEAQGPFGARVTLDGSGSSDADSVPGTNDDIAHFDWYKVDACDPNFEDFLGSGEIIDCNLPLGEHIIVLEVIDKAGAFDTNEVTIIVQDTTPPVITLNSSATITLECRVDSYTEPGATATDICDSNVPVVIGGDTVDTSTCGTYVVTYDATDASGNAAEQVTQTVIVQDTIPPEFALSVTPTTLWPANHKMVLITPTWTASDICDASPAVSLVSIMMNEGDDTKGSGHTTDDIQVDDNGLIYLRAERSGTGSGRIYTITYQAADDSGNVTVASATVTVPHDQR